MTTYKPPKYFEATDELLNSFIARLYEATDSLYRLRLILRFDIEAPAPIPDESCAG